MDTRPIIITGGIPQHVYKYEVRNTPSGGSPGDWRLQFSWLNMHYHPYHHHGRHSPTPTCIKVKYETRQVEGSGSHVGS